MSTMTTPSAPCVGPAEALLTSLTCPLLQNPGAVEVGKAVHPSIIGIQNTEYPVASVGVGVYVAFDVSEGLYDADARDTGRPPKDLLAAEDKHHTAKLAAAQVLNAAAAADPTAHLPNMRAKRVAVETQRVLRSACSAAPPLLSVLTKMRLGTRLIRC